MIATPLVILWIIYGPVMFENFFQLEPEWRKFIPVLGLSGLGVILFVLRRHPDSNPHWIDSMGMLLIGIGPVITSNEILPDDDVGRILIPSFVIVVSVFWFAYFGVLLKPQRFLDPEKLQQEKLHVKRTKHSTLVFFLFVLILSLALFSGINSFNQIIP